MTFVQFIFVSVLGYISQFDSNRPAKFFLKPNRVPIRRWLINIILFFTINVLNNHAFSYNISVPVHIILRSGGSITTLAAGFIWGKRFSRIQVFSVTLLTIGVIVAAYSDAQSKVKSSGKLSFQAHAKISTLEVHGGSTWNTRLQHWSRSSLHCPNIIRYNGPLHRGDV